MPSKVDYKVSWFAKQSDYTLNPLSERQHIASDNAEHKLNHGENKIDVHHRSNMPSHPDVQLPLSAIKSPAKFAVKPVSLHAYAVIMCRFQYFKMPIDIERFKVTLETYCISCLFCPVHRQTYIIILSLFPLHNRVLDRPLP